MHFEIALEQGASSPAIKQLTWILQKGRFQSKYIASLTQLKKKISIRKTHWLVQGLRKVKFRQNQVSPWNTGLEEASFNFVLLLLSCSVVSDSLWSHGLQHARLLCPSPSPWACLNSFSLIGYAIQPSLSFVVPFSSHLQSFPASGSFPMSQVLCIRWPKYCSFSFNISPSNEYSGLIFFTMDWFDVLAV